MISVGVDVGGTFTDCIAVAEGRVATAKVVSTPANPTLAVLDGLRILLESLNRPAAGLARFLHGTTVATNAALQRKGARIGFITTKGFEDALEIGRMSRSDAFDVNGGAETPVFLAPRRMRIGVDERLDSQGSVVTALDEDQVRAAAKLLVETHKAEIIAIGFLFSFLNPAHEKRAREVIGQMYPKLEVVISADVDPGFREYERFTTTLFDAYLRSVVSHYVTDLAGRVTAASSACKVMIMKSSGGLCAPARATEQPLHLLKSGLAGGVKGACAVSTRAGFQDIISIDIGGTSCDVALVRGGAPVVNAECRLDTYPIRVPMVDVNTIGAGGGSIAWIDDAGSLHVGPQSAGSEPGPACYGRGGVDATITDASAVLGFLSPENFAGGLRLDVARSVAAVQRIANRLGIGLVEAASGIHRILNETMANEIRKVSINRGLDVRKFALVALGGGGPVHACELARITKMNTIIVPEYPGLLCAYGLLISDVTHEEVAPVHCLVEPGCAGQVAERCATLTERCLEKLEHDGARRDEVQTEYTAQLRYLGQSFQVSTPLSLDAQDWTDRMVDLFHNEHKRLYGVENRSRKVELVQIRATSTWPQTKAEMISTAAPKQRAEAPRTRKVYDSGRREFQKAQILRREMLPVGTKIQGPAIIEQFDTTTVLPSDARAEVGPTGDLIIRM